MKLLGVVQNNNSELCIVQDKSMNVKIDASCKGSDFPNYKTLINRDSLIGGEAVEGDGVFNFRYGPVTGGVGEAGIYNIYTYGEKILSVNIDTTYKKRNIEKLMIGKNPLESVALAESICGNFAISHSIAFSKAVESISNIKIDDETRILRGILLELERIYNHIYVIAQLANGAAQKVLSSHLYYLFEESLRANESFTGDRFLTNINQIGKLDISLSYEKKKDLLLRLQNIKSRFEDLYSGSLQSGNFLDRLHNTGIITAQKAVEIGLSGPSCRASGIAEDLRTNDYENFEVISKKEGDSLSRMEVRAYEILDSIKFIEKNVENLDTSKEKAQRLDISDGSCVEAVESPSGTMAYYVEIENSKIKNIYVVTPSVTGFKAIADSLVNQIFTDFVFTVESFGVNFADAAR